MGKTKSAELNLINFKLRGVILVFIIIVGFLAINAASNDIRTLSENQGVQSVQIYTDLDGYIEVCNSTHMETKSDVVSVEYECTKQYWICEQEFMIEFILVDEYLYEIIVNERNYEYPQYNSWWERYSISLEADGSSEDDCFRNLYKEYDSLQENENITNSAILAGEWDTFLLASPIDKDCELQDTDGDGYFLKTWEEEVCDGWILYKPNRYEGVGRVVTSDEYWSDYGVAEVNVW